MFNITSMLNIAAVKLKKFLKENDGAWEITVYKANEWLEKNNHPFSLNTDGTNLVIKYHKEKDQQGD